MRRISTLLTFIFSVGIVNIAISQNPNSNTTTSSVVANGLCGALTADFNTGAQGFVSPSPFTASQVFNYTTPSSGIGYFEEPASNPNGSRTISIYSPAYNFNGSTTVYAGFSLRNAVTVTVRLYTSKTTASPVYELQAATTAVGVGTGDYCIQISDADLAADVLIRYEMVITTSGNVEVRFDNFSTGGAAAIALPVKFTGLEAKKAATGTQVTWKVAEEIGVNSYEVEKGTNGKQFTKIGSVAATSSNSYSFTDAGTEAVKFYRIKSVDDDGKFAYSTIISFKNGKGGLVLKSFMSAANKLTVQHEATEPAAKIIISSQDGRVVKSVALATGAMQTEVDVNALTTGIYIVRFDAGNGNIETTRFFKN